MMQRATQRSKGKMVHTSRCAESANSTVAFFSNTPGGFSNTLWGIQQFVSHTHTHTHTHTHHRSSSCQTHTRTTHKRTPLYDTHDTHDTHTHDTTHMTPHAPHTHTHTHTHKENTVETIKLYSRVGDSPHGEDSHFDRRLGRNQGPGRPPGGVSVSRLTSHVISRLTLRCKRRRAISMFWGSVRPNYNFTTSKNEPFWGRG